jgi:alkylhydroperoxidase family enzyme
MEQRGGNPDCKIMTAFIDQPKRIPFYLRIGIWIAEKITGKEMLPARLLAWQPKAAVGSGILESLTAHGRSLEEKRLLRLVRLQAAFAVACPFCVDMNAFELEKHGVSMEEFTALQTNFQTGYPASLSDRERIALEYAKLISATPLKFPPEIIGQVKTEFSDREIVLMATTVSQVNYWARLVQSLGVPPAGFSEYCQKPI